ncbi:hypothetical protein J2S19_002964 [Metabacillus malikii]|uniref:Uncharacterized protein n=1 Tax=Metabacillus malikii TaxID=1504265 RepID=A0ABT9ZKC4_9BACI|nr:hypothetical protein [Metabacillus malikii]
MFFIKAMKDKNKKEQIRNVLHQLDEYQNRKRVD